MLEKDIRLMNADQTAQRQIHKRVSSPERRHLINTQVLWMRMKSAMMILMLVWGGTSWEHDV